MNNTENLDQSVYLADEAAIRRAESHFNEKNIDESGIYQSQIQQSLLTSINWRMTMFNKNQNNTPNLEKIMEAQLQMEIQADNQDQLKSALNMELPQVLQSDIQFASKIIYQSALIVNKVEMQLPDVLSGYLLKKSNKLFTGYHMKWCVLQNSIFRFFNQKDQKRAQGTLNFERFSFEHKCIKDNKDNVLEFGLKSRGKSFVFQFKSSNQKETAQWYSCITTTIQKIEEERKGEARFTSGSSFFLLPYPKFWKREIISNAQFLKESQSGDIILFKGRVMNAIAQRAITDSDYDHVGIILRYEGQQVYCMEATSGSGVGLFKWGK